MFILKKVKQYLKNNWLEILFSIIISFLFWGSLFKYPYRYLFGDFDYYATNLFANKISFIYYHEFPFFTSYIGGGFPLWANPSNMFISIPQFFSIVINNQWLSLRISIVFLSIISILGMFSLLRQLEIKNLWCRLFGAIVYTFSGFLVSHLIIGHFWVHNTVYVPWLASAFIWSYKNDKFSYAIPILLAVMVYAGLNITSIFITIITLSFLTFCKIKRFIIYVVLGILLSAPKLIFSYQLLSWFPRNLTMGYVSETWFGTICTFITALIWPNQKIDANIYKYTPSLDVMQINGYIGILVLLLIIISIMRIKKHKYYRFSYSMLIIIGITLFLYLGKLNPLWSLVSKSLIFGSLHMPTWFIGLFALPFAYFSTLGLYSIEKLYKKKADIILIIICIFIFWDYYRVNNLNLKYIQNVYTINSKSHFSKNIIFINDKGPDWKLHTVKEKVCFESDMMSTYLQDNKGVLQFYDSIMGYGEFGFLQHSSVRSGGIDLYNKNPNIKIEWISPSKISVEIIKMNKKQLEIPININYFPSWKIVNKISGVSLNKNWTPEKWRLLTVYIDENFPVGKRQKILLKYSLYCGFKSINRGITIETKQTELIPRIAEDWYKKGVKLYESYDFENAIIAFDSAIKLKPNYIDAWEEKGWILSKLKKYEDAVTCFDMALKLQKNNNFKRNIVHNADAKDYFIRAAAYLSLNKYKESIESFNDAIKLDIDYVKAYYYRGMCRKKIHDFVKSIKDFNKVILFNSENAGVYYSRGGAYMQIKDYQNAISDFNKCIELIPNYVEAYNLLSNTYCYLEKYDLAIELYRKVNDINSNYGPTYLNLGLLFQNLNRFNEAEIEYKKAIKIAPKQKEAHNYLANLYYMRGEYYKALKEYEIVLELSPNNQVILEKIRVLKQLVKNSIQ